MLNAAVYLGVNDIMRRMLPLLCANGTNTRDGDKPSSYKMDCEVKLVRV